MLGPTVSVWPLLVVACLHKLNVRIKPEICCLWDRCLIFLSFDGDRTWPMGGKGVVLVYLVNC